MKLPFKPPYGVQLPSLLPESSPIHDLIAKLKNPPEGELLFGLIPISACRLLPSQVTGNPEHPVGHLRRVIAETEAASHRTQRGAIYVFPYAWLWEDDLVAAMTQDGHEVVAHAQGFKTISLHDGRLHIILWRV